MNQIAYVDQLSDLSVRELIDARAERMPDAPFLIDPEAEVTVTFGELRRRAEHVASVVAARGIQQGESVAYAMTNGVESASCILGLLYGGFLATAVNLVAGNDTLTHVLGHSEARLVLGQEATLAVIEQPVSALADPPDVVVVDERFFSADVSAEPLAPPSPPLAADDDGVLMYTSGTTGRPKGVVLTQRSLLAGGANTAIAHQLTGQDRALCVLPLYHINGLCVTVMGPLVSGGSVVVPPRFSVSTFWSSATTNQCTWFSVVPTQISYLLHEPDDGGASVPDLGTIRFGRSASAPLSPDVQEAFEARFGVPIIETMGLTETAAQILSNPLPPEVRKIGSPGVAVGNEVTIADDDQHELDRGREGEVLVRGPNVMNRYLKDEKATDEALTSAGWLRTGDLGRMDDDGYVFITGRLKELIIKGGENIAPREVDEALYSHPDVIEAAAFACECETYGQRIEAGVVLSDDSPASETDLIELCRAKIGAFKCPDRVHVLDELPKGPSGKIQRLKLRDLLAGS